MFPKSAALTDVVKDGRRELGNALGFSVGEIRRNFFVAMSIPPPPPTALAPVKKIKAASLVCIRQLAVRRS